MELNILMCVFVLFEVYILETRALKNMHIIVPEAVKRGSNVTLVCDYDLESAALYSIKWYKDEEEFYRFVPKEAPPDQSFDVPFINVDISKSNSSEVTLVSVERETSGEFKCEVSADAPLFHTDIQVAKLQVVDIPEDKPVLRVEVQKIAPGAYLRANCSTPPSYPTANVTWVLNNKVMNLSRHNSDIDFKGIYRSPDIDHDVHIAKSIFHFDSLPGLETTQSTFAVKTRPDLFIKGKITLRCLATMFDLYESAREAEIQEDAPKLALVMVHKDQRNRGNSLVFWMDKNAGLLRSLLISFVFVSLKRIQGV
ncbi:uncharacterized protein LOC130442015 [Diorhabda sublineata]|uniref:uncharacterized protein LOC130442015 n=1 Tax=Diorhabda sublineata TaxID=1163346 RepID=UPI0024E0EDFD|nr:uncharacterized protein LOC130442015 [Diorhabda sublineata]XP_056631946.1 uncharacterized protein LOC130442015 [Diorhabda sublineata]